MLTIPAPTVKFSTFGAASIFTIVSAPATSIVGEVTAPENVTVPALISTAVVDAKVELKVLVPEEFIIVFTLPTAPEKVAAVALVMVISATEATAPLVVIDPVPATKVKFTLPPTISSNEILVFAVVKVVAAERVAASDRVIVVAAVPVVVIFAPRLLANETEIDSASVMAASKSVSYTHLRAHET